MQAQELKYILSIPTSFGYENLVKDYINSHAITKNYTISNDEIGNLYITKGLLNKNEFYPCFCAHMDTVFDDFFHKKESHTKLVEKKKHKNIIKENINGKESYIAYHPIYKNQRTGIGGDNLAGIFIILSILDKIDKGKAIFFVQEEKGLIGSKKVKWDFLTNIGYIISFDAPTGSWYSRTINGMNIFNKKFDDLVYPVLKRHGIGKKNYSDDCGTDIINVIYKSGICGANISAGFYQYHTNKEYVVIEETLKMIKLGLGIIKKLGLKKYFLLNN